MARLLHHKMVFAGMALATLLAAAASPARAGSVSYEAYAYGTISYDPGSLPAGVSTYGSDPGGYNAWFGDKDGATSGYSANQSGYWTTEPTDHGAFAHAAIGGYGEAYLAPQTSGSFSVAYSGSYLGFWNSNPDPVSIAIAISHVNSASASGYVAPGTGYSFAESELRFEIYNDFGGFVYNRWYVRADQDHTNALINLDDSYLIYLYPGHNDIGIATYVFGYDSVTAPAAAAVPEPSSVCLLGLGAVASAGVGFRRRRRPAAISTP